MIKEIIRYGELEVVYAEKKFRSQSPKITNLFWETTLRCNANCKHCGSRAGQDIKKENELTTEEIKNVFKSIENKYNPKSLFISVTGGEPLVRKDVFDVMKYASDLGFSWGMTTNGMLINDEVIQKMKDSKMLTVSISIDGLEKTHDEFRGVKGSYKKIIENIKKLSNANFLHSIMVTTVVNKQNIGELDEIYNEIKDIGTTTWRLLNIEPIGRAEDNKDLYLDSNDYKYLMKYIKEKRKKSKIAVTYGCAHYLGLKNEREVRDNCYTCYAGLTIGSILYNGDIFVCPNVERRPELIQGNVRKDDFVEVWENKFKWFRDLDKFKTCTQCSKCEDWKYCLGDSVHSWDFENNKPKLCLNKILKGKG